MRLKKFCPYCGGSLVSKFIEGTDRRWCSGCNAPVYENPVPATCTVVLNEADEILLVRRAVDPKKGMWCLPGGFVELGEAPEEAALRELKEETGLTGRIHRLLGVQSTDNRLYHTVFVIGYLVTDPEGAPMAGDDALEVRWFSAGALPEIAFGSHRRFIRIIRATRIG